MTTAAKSAMNSDKAVGNIAYLGPAGTHSHAALLKFFGDSAAAVPLASIDEVFTAIENGDCDYGVVPVENSTEGAVNLTLDCFKNSRVKICGEVLLRIHHFFMTGAETELKGIKRIVSHQQSLAQCRKWLDRHWPQLERLPVNSNAEAARIAANEAGVAAIAGERAAELYGLKILDREIEDSEYNTTRFLVIGGACREESSGRDKTSIIITTLNQPGALYKALEPFYRHGINMTKLQSRPSGHGTWGYSFFVDFDGHLEQEEVLLALDELKQQSQQLIVLGSYPAGEESE